MSGDFTPILNVVQAMRGIPARWFVSGGWAIDLFLGEVTRTHSDIEIGIYRRDQQAVWRQLHGWIFEKALPARGEATWMPWKESEELELSIHQIRATRGGGKAPEFEFFLNERTDTHWFSRRHPSLTRPVAEVERVGPFGIPILAPEIQLLFKAKQTRPKDQADLELTLPRLNPGQCEWLAAALCEFYPQHSWCGVIG